MWSLQFKLNTQNAPRGETKSHRCVHLWPEINVKRRLLVGSYTHAARNGLEFAGCHECTSFREDEDQIRAIIIPAIADAKLTLLVICEAPRVFGQRIAA